VSYFKIGWFPYENYKLFGFWLGRKWHRIRVNFFRQFLDGSYFEIGWDRHASWVVVHIGLFEFGTRKFVISQLNERCWKFTVIDFQFLKFRVLLDLCFRRRVKIENKKKEQNNLVEMPVVDLGKIDLENIYV